MTPIKHVGELSLLISGALFTYRDMDKVKVIIKADRATNEYIIPKSTKYYFEMEVYRLVCDAMLKGRRVYVGISSI